MGKIVGILKSRVEDGLPEYIPPLIFVMAISAYFFFSAP